MDVRVLAWFAGPVVLIALLVNLVRSTTARPLDPLAGSTRWRSVRRRVGRQAGDEQPSEAGR